MSRVVVVGAGIAGLAAAWDLAQAGADVTVLESERRPGGVIITERRDGFLVEGGPDGFLAAEPELPALAAELGIADRVVAQRARGSSLWTGQGGGGGGGSSRWRKAVPRRCWGSKRVAWISRRDSGVSPAGWRSRWPRSRNGS